MAIYDFFLSRNNAATTTAENYVGHVGRLFYDDTTGVIKLSDGVTPGGLSIPYTIASNTVVGGVKAGPGVTINSEGQILIDSEGLSFSFGDFSGTVGTYTDTTDYALLQSVNADEDIVIASNGDGGVKVVGEFRAYATNGTVTGSLEDAEPIFRVKADGQVRMLVPKADQVAGAFEVIGNDTGVFHPPNQTGVIIHATGNTGLPARNYLDAINNYPIIVGRRMNGIIGAVTPVLDGEVIFRIAGQASTGTNFETFGPAKINWMATEDQGPNNQGGKITIDVTANGTTAFGNAITAAEFTATGVVSTVGFVGDLTGNADTVTNGVYTTDTGTVTNTMLAGSIANAKLSNSTISGVALGSNLAALTAGTYLTSGGTYTGGTARTFAVDATTTATASKVVARDANANIAAATTSFATRQAGSFGAGQTLTINMATDKYVHANITGETVTVAYTNITAGKEIYIFFTNATGADLAVNSGIADTRATNAKGTENVKNGGTSQIRVTSFGTTVADCYAHFKK